MLVAFDAHMLIWLFDDQVQGLPLDAEGHPISNARERVAHLLARLSADGDQIVVPAPALAEFLAGVAPQDQAAMLQQLSGHAALRVEPFDDAAAAECARFMAARLKTGRLGNGTPGSRTTAKFDTQILAVSAVVGVERIYTTDGKLAAAARKEGMEAVMLGDLSMPPPPPVQGTLWDDPPTKGVNLTELGSGPISGLSGPGGA